MSNNLSIAFEIGGTKLQCAVGTREGDLLWQSRGEVSQEDGVGGILAWVDAQIPVLDAKARDLGAHESELPMAIGFGGPVDTDNAVVLISHQVDGWSGVNWRDRYGSAGARNVHLFNDSNAAGWGEYCRGAGRGTRNFAYMNIGSGIGGALIIDGKLHDGQGFGAAELGHTLIPDWTAQMPGKSARAEDLCSGWAIERRLRFRVDLDPAGRLLRLADGNPSMLSCRILGEAAALGDLQAVAEIQRVAEGVGIALANMITLLHPERVALGGGVPLMGDVLLDPIRESVSKHVFAPYRNRYEIVPCALGENVVLVGALCLAAVTTG